jgi:hypothetical protein
LNKRDNLKIIDRDNGNNECEIITITATTNTILRFNSIQKLNNNNNNNNKIYNNNNNNNNKFIN